jgi:hypothetical protein
VKVGMFWLPIRISVLVAQCWRHCAGYSRTSRILLRMLALFVI